MAKKEVKPFLLRIDPRVLAAMQRWAEEDLRSLNGQIEFILRQALAKRGVKLTEEPPLADAPVPAGSAVELTAFPPSLHGPISCNLFIPASLSSCADASR